MRAFLAFDLDAALLDSATALTDRLRERVVAKGGRICRRETLHVTARFFGDGVELASVAGLAARLVGERGAPRVRVAKLDAFSEARRAKVLVLSLEDDGTMADIAREAERRAVERGFAEEKRAYRPHLTVARFRQPADVRDLVAETRVDLAGTIEALTLYESKLGPNGPSYAALERVPFAR